MNQIESLYQQPSFNNTFDHPQRHYVQSPLANQYPVPSSPAASLGHDLAAGTVQAKAQAGTCKTETSKAPLHGSAADLPAPLHQSQQRPSGSIAQVSAAPLLSPAGGRSNKSPSGSASPQKYPMAAPPLPASVRQQSPRTSSNGSPQPSSPHTSSADAAREKERVALLLDINLDLLREMNRLQAKGMGGAPNQQQAAQMKASGLPDKLASDEYIQVYYRVSANISYLYNQPDMQLLNPQNHGQLPQKNGPSTPPPFMWAPPHMPALSDKYAALRELFPGWLGRDAPGGQTDGQA